MMDETFEAATMFYDGEVPAYLQAIMVASVPFLKREWDRTMQDQMTPACGDGSCAGCGSIACAHSHGAW